MPTKEVLARVDRQLEVLRDQQEALDAIMSVVPWPIRVELAGLCGLLADQCRDPGVPLSRVGETVGRVIAMNEDLLRRFSS